MIRLLIVDDEALTRDSLVEYVDWKGCGVSEIYTAANGVSALEMAERFPLDILLCDVRMPRMNGIQLAQKIRERDRRCRIIFISGYTDKEYLQTAIELGAVRYIEKPFEIDALERLVRDLVDDIELERSLARQRDDLDRRVTASRPLLHQDILDAWLHPAFDAARFEMEYSGPYFPWPAEGIYLACVLLVHMPGEPPGGRGVVRLLYPILDGARETMGFDFVLGLREEGRILLVLRDMPLGAFAASGLPQTLREQLRPHFPGMSLSIGVSAQCGQLMQVPRAIAEADAAADQWFYDGFQEACYRAPDAMRGDDFPRIEAALRDGVPFSDAFARTMQALRTLRPVPIRPLQAYLFDAYEALAARSALLREDERVGTQAFFAMTLSQLDGLFAHTFRKVLRRNDFQQDLSPKMQLVSQYVRDRYAQPNLTIGRIAEAADLSPNYLCTLFKKETGMTLNQYIQQLRMERVHEMLLYTDAPLYRIAQETGFSDANYLSNVFKRIHHVSPTQYRVAMRGGQGEGQPYV